MFDGHGWANVRGNALAARRPWLAASDKQTASRARHRKSSALAGVGEDSTGGSRGLRVEASRIAKPRRGGDQRMKKERVVRMERVELIDKQAVLGVPYDPG
jgi:hypothetical protein